MGPLAYILYTGPLSDIINAYSDVNHMIYADDTQIYVTLKSSYQDSITKLEACISDIRSWAMSNKLMLNESKTEIIHLHSKFRTSPNFPTIRIGDVEVSSSVSACDLGAIIDTNLQLHAHIKNICKSANYGIYKIGRIRKYLDQKTTERLVHAFVTSRIDYGNSLLYGLPSSVIQPLQKVQNSAARVITRSKRSDHISNQLRNLHWLPVNKRIIFKILLMTFKIYYGLAPDYLIDLISPYSCTSNSSLRSQNRKLLNPGPRTKTKFYGERAFSVASPKLWNALPLDIRLSPSINSFKSKLKTYLFENSFI